MRKKQSLAFSIFIFCVLKIAEISAAVVIYAFMTIIGRWLGTVLGLWHEHAWAERWIGAPFVAVMATTIVGVFIFWVSYLIYKFIRWNWRIATRGDR